MRFKLTIALVILNLIAFGWIYVLEQEADPRDVYLRETVNVLPNAANVEQISIQVNTTQRQEERVIERRRNGWEITKPFVWMANENAVQRILTQLQFLEKETVMPIKDIERSGQSLADFGLEQPSFILTYKTASEETVLNIGAPTHMGNSVYLHVVGSDNVLVVSNELLKAITISLAELRSDRVFDIPLFEVRSLGIEEGTQRFRFEEMEEDWWLVTPIRARANTAMVEAVLGDLTALRSLNIVKDLPAGGEPAIFDEPFMRITLEGNKRRRSLLVGTAVADLPEGQPAQRYARLEDAAASSTIFTVEQAPLERLKGAGELLRERQFLVFDIAKVDALEIQQREETLTLQKLEQQTPDAQPAWQMISKGPDGNPQTESADSSLVASTLYALRNLEAKAFVSDAPSDQDLEQWGLKSPNNRVIIQGETEQTLLLGIGKEDGLDYAKLASEPFVYRVSALILLHVSADPLDFRTRLLDPTLTGARVVSLTLTDIQTGETRLTGTIDISKETWSTYWQDKPEAQRQPALDLISLLESFSVKSYLSTQYAVYDDNPWRYRLLVEYFLPGSATGETTQRTYTFTQRLKANHQIGGAETEQLTFTLTQPMIDALYEFTTMADPPSVPSTPEAVEQAIPAEATTPAPEQP